MNKNQTLSSFHKLVWRDMSEYVRRSRANFQGKTKCYTCPKLAEWKELDAGHLRHLDALDFEKNNIRPQCFTCNRMQSGKRDVFVLNLQKEIGLEKVEALYKINTHTFTFKQLREIRKELKKRLADL